MFHLLAVQSFLTGIGIMLVILSLCLLFMRGYRKDGILILFFSNFPIWSAIVFPKQISDLCLALGFNPDFLNSDLIILGLIIGALLCGGIFVFLRKLHRKQDAIKNNTNEQQEEQPQNTADSCNNSKREPSIKTEDLINNEDTIRGSDYVNPEVFSSIKKKPFR